MRIGVHAAYQALTTALAIGYGVWALRPMDPAAVEEGARKRSLLSFFRRGQKTPRRKYQPIPDGANPIFRRELYWGSPLSGRGARRLAFLVGVLCIGVSLLILTALGNTSTGRNGHLVVVMINMALFGGLACLYVPVVCANAYTKEAALSNFDLLRGTLLRPADIVRGKFLAALVLVAAVWAACVAVNLPLIVTYMNEPENLYFLAVGYTSLFASLLTAATVGLFVSFYSRRTGPAIVGSYIVLFMVYFGAYLFAMTVVVVGMGNFDEEDPLFVILLTGSPVLSYFWYASDLIGARSGLDMYSHVYEWVCSLLFSIGLAAVAQYWMIRRFHARFEKMAGH